MSDLIIRQAAIDALEKVAELFPWRVPGNRDTYDRYNEAWNDAIERAEIEIEELPSAQPKSGKWIHHPEIGWGETWLCDQCGEKTTSTVMGKPRANFCPNCGADMRGEQDE